MQKQLLTIQWKLETRKKSQGFFLREEVLRLEAPLAPDTLHDLHLKAVLAGHSSHTSHEDLLQAIHMPMRTTRNPQCRFLPMASTIEETLHLHLDTTIVAVVHRLEEMDLTHPLLQDTTTNEDTSMVHLPQ